LQEKQYEKERIQRRKRGGEKKNMPFYETKVNGKQMQYKHRQKIVSYIYVTDITTITLPSFCGQKFRRN